MSYTTQRVTLPIRTLSEGNNQPITKLIGHLQTGDSTTVSEAAYFLGELGPRAKTAIPALINIRDQSEDPEVRANAAEAIAKIQERHPLIK